ncbi:MAG TPA: response regulator [Anaeromyxobacteraceae bacterium]|nr:response regulator [Anaeromyxobacteraceae bacterium]
MKILVCCESELVREMLALALGGAGHQVTAADDPFALVGNVAGAGALLVDAARARQAVALLRDRGFLGRSLLVGDGAPEDLARQAGELGADGALPAAPPDDLERRFQAALAARRRVLIVDDSEIVARLLKEELEQKGFEIQYAPDAEKATSIILKRQTRPDVILLDINMPKVDGAQFCRFVKKNEMFRAIKVVFCSGEAKERVRQLAEECGADGYILKDDLLGKWIVDNTG